MEMYGSTPYLALTIALNKSSIAGHTYSGCNADTKFTLDYKPFMILLQPVRPPLVPNFYDVITNTIAHAIHLCD